ncbi:MAG: protocatechuate 3,4-dioxygenase subunit alpha [Burkholderiaceae bacterium]
MAITPSQTVGPFPHEAWRWAIEATAAATLSAPAVTLTGVVRDGDGLPVPDALIEAWIPGGSEMDCNEALPGFRRVATDASGCYTLSLPPPKNVAAVAPAAFICLFARGLVRHQFSVLFLDDQSGLADSPLLAQVPPERRPTIVARSTAVGNYVWDIRLQGDHETVFFDYC